MSYCVSLQTAREVFATELGAETTAQLFEGMKTRSLRKSGGGNVSYKSILVVMSALLGVTLCALHPTVAQNMDILKMKYGVSLIPMFFKLLDSGTINYTGKLNLLHTVLEKLSKYALDLKHGGVQFNVVAPTSVQNFFKFISVEGGAANAEKTFVQSKVPSAEPVFYTPLSRDRSRKMTRINKSKSIRRGMFEVKDERTLVIHTVPPIRLFL